MPEDSIERLKADLARDAPLATRMAVDHKAEEFLASCVRFARMWQLHPDPWLGIRHLSQAILTMNEANRLMSEETPREVKIVID